MLCELKQVALFYDAAQFASSEEIDFHVWVFPKLSDAVESSTSGVLSLHRETKFIIGFDFAVTLCSPGIFFVFFFDITSEHSAELKWLMVKQKQKMIPFITSEISLGQHVCELVFGFNVFDLNFGVQITSIE